MTSRDFCYWLQGHFELSKCEMMDKRETEMVKRHLALVFKHEIDPSYGGDAAELQAIHDGTNPPRPPFEHEQLIRC